MKVSPITQTNTYKSKAVQTKSYLRRIVSNAKTKTIDFMDEVKFIWGAIKRSHTYVYYGGEKVCLSDVPNYAGMPDGVVDKGVTFGKVKFYKEDLDILSKMENVRERINYKRKLIEAGKYYD